MGLRLDFKRWWHKVLLPGMALRVVALWKLAHHAQTPRAARILAFVVLAYALSPLDFIPDFIPILGHLDDLVLVPLGIALVVKLVPASLWQTCLAEAQGHIGRLPQFFRGVWIVIAVWLVLLALFVAWLLSVLGQA